MKTLTTCLIMASWASIALWSEDEASLPGYRATYPEQVVDLDYLSVTPQKGSGKHVSFSDTNAILNKKLIINNRGNVAALVGIRRLGFGNKSHVRPQNTNYAVLGTSFEYTSMNRWNWSGILSLQPDIHWFDLLRTTRYIASIHGRYQKSKDLGVHVGAYLETGMRITILQPIIGVDYTYGQWIYQAVFPIKGGVSYTGFNHHILSLMARSMYVGAKSHSAFSHKPVTLQYRSTGIEFRWDLLPSQCWKSWISLGQTITGTLRKGNKNFHHTRLTTLHPSPYCQIGITVAI